MLSKAIKRFFSEHRLAPRRVVVAASGGFDSTALLLAMAELRDRVDVVAGHVNHHLRGEESDGDEAFVRGLCEQIGVPLHVGDGTLDAEAVRERGIEAAAREVRFARLQEIRREVDADYIATAHQKNDQAETVLMRLLTGGSPASLRGIHPVRADGIIRPLLDVRRCDIVAWLDERGIQPRIDRSNSDPRFLRNRVRKLLVNGGPAAIDNLARTAVQVSAQWPILERAIDAAEDAVVTDDETRFLSMPDNLWLRQALLHRHIVRLDPAHARDVSAKDLGRLADEVPRAEGRGPSGARPPLGTRHSALGTSKRSVTKELELVRQDGALVLRRRPQPTVPFELPLAPDQPARVNGVLITVERALSGAEGQRIQLPTSADPTFVVRSRRPGDRFHPLGYPAETKLKRFLISRKVPREQRDRLPLVTWNGEIIWVAGVAVSERFKTTGGEGDVYVLSVT